MLTDVDINIMGFACVSSSSYHSCHQRVIVVIMFIIIPVFLVDRSSTVQ